MRRRTKKVRLVLALKSDRQKRCLTLSSLKLLESTSTQTKSKIRATASRSKSKKKKPLTGKESKYLKRTFKTLCQGNVLQYLYKPRERHRNSRVPSQTAQRLETVKDHEISTTHKFASTA